ncbi:Transcriptional activator protein AnoR [Alphaproteobacteria bacterium SO-S41]|nr:Transcriptional activator protein AnoR [Alphaproteobacteria bacterium SO-S41]
MELFSKVSTFIEKAKKVRRLDELDRLLEATADNLGFDFYALGHHVDLQLPPENAVRLLNYPTAWFKRVLERRYFVDDPILLMSQRAVAGFRWSEVPDMMALTARQKAILAQAPREGLGAGYTVPVHVPGEYAGSVNFAVRTERKLPEASLPSAQYVGTVAFEAARRFQLASIGAAKEPPAPLSPRQRDCVALVALGKSDKEIAQRLGIKPVTVKSYIEDAMAHHHTTRRTQLVVRALFQGDISFSDVIK